jgi:hypothetical protein
MRRINILGSLLLLSLYGFAQSGESGKYAGIVNAENLKKHLLIIASDSMEGRETGTEGQRKAAAYIEEQFKRIGLQQAGPALGYQQIYPLYRDSLLQSTLTLGGENAIPGDDYVIPLNTNVSKASFHSSYLVFAGYGIDDPAYNDYRFLNVRGKVVVFFLGEPKREGRFFINPDGSHSKWSSRNISIKLETAAARGAVGALIIDPLQAGFDKRIQENSKKTNLYLSSKKDLVNKVSYAMVSHLFAQKILKADFETILQKARSYEALNEQVLKTRMPVACSFEKTTLSAASSSNVIGLVEGTDKKEEYVFLTAHYDHLGIRDGKIYNGADDDGSGTVALIQMAEAFVQAKKEGKGPKRTVVFIAFSGEEKGLWGSEYYTDNPIFSLEKTSVNLNTDMIGRIDTERKTADTLNYIYVVGHDKISSDLPLINEAINKEYTQLLIDYKFDDPADPYRIYFRSDHYNFARKGVPVLFFYDGMLKADYHKPTDDIEFINWPLFEKRAQLIFHIAWEIANRNEMLKRDKPIPSATR